MYLLLYFFYTFELLSFMLSEKIVYSYKTKKVQINYFKDIFNTHIQTLYQFLWNFTKDAII